jgi:hypothetical protein
VRQAECKGNVIGDNDDDYVCKCHTCGETQGATATLIAEALPSGPM